MYVVVVRRDVVSRCDVNVCATVHSATNNNNIIISLKISYISVLYISHKSLESITLYYIRDT